MTANASKNKQTENSMMAPLASRVSESVLQIMQMFGIQRTECKKIKSADFERIVADIKPFEGTPQEIVACGMLVKDALTEILAAVGVVSLEINANDEEHDMLIKTYETVVKAYNDYIMGTLDSTDDNAAAGNKPDAKEVSKINVDNAGTSEAAVQVVDLEAKSETEDTQKDATCATKCCKRSKK